VDSDVREALDALIRTQKTLESGLYYQTRPANPIAAQISEQVRSGLEAFRRQEREQLGLTKTRDADILGILAFFQRLEFDRNNGRKHGKAFLDFLRGNFSQEELAPASSIIVP
jgi:hypothetical protein